MGLAITLIHGAGVDWPGPRIVTYSRPPSAKPPRPLKNSTPGGCTRDLKLGSGRSALCRDPRQRPGLGQAVEVIDEPSALSDQDNTRDGQEKGLHLGRGQVGAQHEDVPG